MVYLSSSFVMMWLVGCFSVGTWSLIKENEVCDGEDNDLDGLVDEGVVQYADMDGDGFGDPAAPELSCEGASGFVLDDGDCDDGAASVNPEGEEVCDEVDNNCDGVVDNDAIDATTYYADEDGDGFGDPATRVVSCEDTSGFVLDDGDCNDADTNVNPDAVELCGSGADEDCDGSPAPCGVEGALTDGDADYTIVGGKYSALGYDLTAGDLNGDGEDDLVVGANGTDVSTSLADAGAVYVVYGPIAHDLSLPADADLTMTGVAAYDDIGRAISADGDVNGDGVDDLLISAPGYDPDGWYAGGAALVYGSSSGRTGSFTFTTGDALWLGAAKDDYLGTVAQIIGDFNGDGYDDIVLGGSFVGPAGAVYLFAGSATKYSGLVSTSTADVTISGVSGDRLGDLRSVSGRVDIDGDGLNELVLGDHFNGDAGGLAGAVYLTYGNNYDMGSGGLSVSTNFADVTFTGVTSGDYLGRQISGVGDTDGDGYDELIVGGRRADPGGASEAGCAWLLPGGSAMYSGKDHIDYYSSAEFCGVGTNDNIGEATYGGDLNGDAFADVVVASSYVDVGATAGAGAAYVFYGPVSGSYLTTDADASLSGTNIDEWMGLAGAILDYDGDGADDLLIGAYGDDAAYLWRGGGL